MREEGAKRGIALCLGKKERNEKSPNVNKRKKVKYSNDGNEETIKTIKLINSEELKLLSTSLPSDILLEKTNVYDVAIIHYSNTLV